MTLWKQIIVLVTLLVAMRASRTYADSIQKVDKWRVDLINSTIEQYKQDTNRDWTCTIDWTKVNINSIIFWKVANESAYGTKWAGAKYNNWGNMKRASSGLPKQVAQGKKTKHLDWWQYFLYDKIEDWIYDMVEWNKRRGDWTCTIGFESSFMYLKWSKSPRTAKNIADTKRYLNQLKETALYYEKNKELFIVDNEQTRNDAFIVNDTSGKQLKRNVASKTPAVVAWTKRCKIIMNAPADGYIQIDSIAWKFINWLKWVKKTNKIFFCRDIK